MALPRSRRLEAHPFDWMQLTTRQRQAVETISELLLDALAGLSRSQAGAQGLDFNRHSQLGFIDGDRGTGKTSVLLAIRRLTSAEELGPQPFPAAVKQLHDVRHRLVWLETLDMEPLPRTANLLAAILARIAERLEHPSRRPTSRMAAAFDELDELERVASDLQGLEVDAVLAWQGTDPQRSHHTEPTSYAAEVISSERAGLRLSPRFDKVLAGLASLIAPRNAQDPMFIIPVDDFDLAPTRCLELLRIIRMVTSPRLFFLVAGNTRIAEVVLRLQEEGELAALAGHEFTALETRAVSLASLEIAANNLRKLVPPTQRVQLTDVGLEEALKFASSPTSPSLEQALESVTFERNNAPPGRGSTSLKSFLLFDDPLPPNLYSGAQWLGGKPRQVLDRIAIFEMHAGPLPEWGRNLLRDVADDLARETREHPSLERDQRERLSQLLDTTSKVRFNFHSEMTLLLEVEQRRSVPFSDGVVRFSTPSPFRWMFRDQTETKSPQHVPVPDHLGAGLTLLHDLAVSLWGGYVFPNSIHYQHEGFFEYGAARWGQDYHDEVEWYLPEWWTLREYERWQGHWQTYAQDAESVDDYVRGWLAAGLDILLDRQCDVAGGTALERLRRDLDELAHEQPIRFCRKYLRDSALVGIVLVLAPESACSLSLATVLAGRDSPLWSAVRPDLVERIRQRRARTFANTWAGGDRSFDSAPMKLLCAINPKVATDAAVAGLEEAAGTPGGQTKTLLERVSSGALRTKDSKEALQLLQDAEVSGRLKTAIEAAAVAVGNPFKDHPINTACKHGLVPDKQEIEAVRPDGPWRRRPR